MNVSPESLSVPIEHGAIKQSRSGLTALVWLGLFVLYLVSTFLFKVKSAPLEWAWMTVLLLPLVPWWFNRRAIRALAVAGVHCAPFHHGEQGALGLALRNQSAGLVADIQIDCPKLKQGVEGELDPKSQETFLVPLNQLGRGVHPLPSLRLTTSFPFGIFISSRPVNFNSECVIYPAIEPQAPHWPVSSVLQKRRSRAGEDVVALRDYVVGDAMSTIDWKVTARQGDLVVREFEEPVQQALVFSYEDVRFLGLEAALERLTAWVVRASKQGLTYGVDLEGKLVPPATGVPHRHRCLEALARFRQEPSA